MDPNHPTKIVKGKDLKPGDAIIKPHPGMVTDVDIEGINPTWSQPNISYYDVYDCAYGYMTGPLNLEDDFEIFVDRKDILEMYKKIDYDILQYIADTIDRRKAFKDIFNEAINSMNLKKWASRKEKIFKGE